MNATTVTTSNAASELNAGIRLDVYVIKPTSKGSVWKSVGSAFVNRDSSINVVLDALPLNGRLHIRKPNPKTPDAAAPTADSPSMEDVAF